MDDKSDEKDKPGNVVRLSPKEPPKPRPHPAATVSFSATEVEGEVVDEAIADRFEEAIGRVDVDKSDVEQAIQQQHDSLSDDEAVAVEHDIRLQHANLLEQARNIALQLPFPQEGMRQIWAAACLAEAFMVLEYEGMRLEGVQGAGIRDMRTWFEEQRFLWCQHLISETNRRNFPG